MRLAELMGEFEGLDSTERLELLVELGDELPPVSETRGPAPFPPECRVQECQTAVHLWVEVQAGQVALEADVPRKSPTVRGLVTLLVLGLQGASPAEVLAVPEDLIGQLGLADALGMTRRQGVQGMIRRIKQAVRAELPADKPVP
ncbi:MAG TPA: SufE family protein [Planctomycetaceae bacterium]|nr:SufE family protein [Planctomycetaceae bacterium]